MKMINDQPMERSAGFGYELLRNELIPELLGKEQASILYWAGKNLARKHPVESIEELSRFFHDAGWGNLAIEREKKNKIMFAVRSPLLSKQAKNEAAFTLEAGFLAQQYERMKNRVADAHASCKSGVLHILVEWDLKDTVNDTVHEETRSRRRSRTR
ncbi:MAG TPA: YslB family protein [Bacillales bacterium]|nr:YslB family protein [Bacillales bacterium]